MMVSDLAGRSVVNDSPTWLRATLKNGAIEVAGRRVEGLRLAPADVGSLRTNNREYPGALEIVKSGDGLTVVNELPLEDYLAGAVKAEAGDKMPLEMLKAQAIVARTYAAYHRRLNAEKAFHLVASTRTSSTWAACRPTRWCGPRCGRPRARCCSGRASCSPPSTTPTAAATPRTRGWSSRPRNMPALKPVRVEFPSESPAPALAPRAAARRAVGGPAARRDLDRPRGRPRRARAERVPAGGPHRGARHRAAP